MRILPPFVFLTMLLSGVLPLLAQAPKPSATPRPALRNGGFELGRTREDLWDGVDTGGFLAGERAQVPILTTSGTINDSSMPVSVAVADMNGDGLLDIVAMDAIGYLRIYFNSGTKTEPKFGPAEIVPVYLTRVPRNGVPGIQVAPTYLRYAPRIALYDGQRSGKMDVYIGNYWGEIFYLRNDGTGTKPEFRQPADVSRITIPTSKDSNKWGNVFAPVVWDWNKDGKEDLLVGEGSYSANNIHLLINSGTGARPVFEDTNRTVIAFGDGREQLSPCVVDYNGDGNPDLLVTERTGKVALHLNPGGTWKPGVELPFSSFVSVGGNSASPLSFGGISTIATGDLNGDGLFDIVAGKTNGRIAVAYNTGTKTEPKFSAPVELKGDGSTPALKLPSGWDVDYGLTRGNYYAFASLVTDAEDPDAKPTEGKAALKFGYQPSPNKVMNVPGPTQYTGALDPRFAKDAVVVPSPSEVEIALRNAPANWFLLRMPSLNLKQGQAYTLSFKVKGSGLTNGQVMLGFQGVLQLSEARVVKGTDRDAATVVKNEVREDNKEVVTFNAGTTWNEVKKDFTVNFKDRRLNDPKTTNNGALEINFALQPMAGKVYFDDVQITPR